MDAEEAGFKTNEMTLTAIVQSKSAKEIILETMEKESFHYFIIFLVLVDLIILMVQQVLTLHHLEGYIHDEHGMEIGHEFLFILSCMVLACFVVEIVLKIALLREEFLRDVLNVMDTFVIFFSLPFEIYLHLFNSAIAQISAPIIIVFRFYKVLRGIHHISESVEHKNRIIIQQITDEKMRAMARVNNYQSMIHELSKQVLEKEERAQEALAEQEVLLKQIKRVGRRNRKRNNSTESLEIPNGRSSTTPPGISAIDPGSLDPEKDEKDSEKTSTSSLKEGKFWQRRSRILDITSIILPPTEAPGDLAGETLMREASPQRPGSVDEESRTILSQPLVDEPEQDNSIREHPKEGRVTMTRKAYTSEKKRRASTQPLASPIESLADPKRKSGKYIGAEPIKNPPLAKTNRTVHRSSVLRERRRKSMQLRDFRVAQIENRMEEERRTLTRGELPHSPSSFFDSDCEENPPLAPALSLHSRASSRVTLKSESRSTSSANRVASRPRRNTLNPTPNPRQAVNRPSTTRKPMANPNSSREALGKALSIIPPPRPSPEVVQSYHTTPNGTRFTVSRPSSQIFPPSVAFSTPPEFIISHSKSQSDLRSKPTT